MKWSLVILAGATLAVGCGKKKQVESSATSAVADATQSASENTPERKFKENLTQLKVANWEPTSNSGAQFIYNSLVFKADGSWSADGVVKANFEEFPCKEGGSWSVASIESASSGIIDWTLNSTTCITREKGIALRTHISILGSDKYKISFR